MAMSKTRIDDIALFGGRRLFDQVKSTANLVRPDFEAFLRYSEIFFKQRQYSNNGPVVQLLEQRLAAFHGTQHCVTFCGAFWALVLTMTALAKPGRSEVVMPSLTYRRLADIVAWTGLKPHFCEVDPDMLAMTAATARPCINENTALILAPHPIINCCDVTGLTALAAEHDLPLLFDSVESTHEWVDGRKTGGNGNAEVYSIHASKLVNGFEGGYVTTNDAELARRLSLRRGFGFDRLDGIGEDGGMNAKLNEVHAAMALASMDDLEDQVGRNKARYRAYQAAFASVPGIRLLEFDESQRPGFKNIVVELEDGWPLSRDETVRLLHGENALVRAYYSPAQHQKGLRYPHVPASLPLTDRLAERFLLMPCGHFIEEADIHALAGFFNFLRDHAGAVRQRLAELPA